MDAPAEPLLLTDTTFRDAHQSLFATRMRSNDILAMANLVSHRAAGSLQPRDVGRRHVRLIAAFSAWKIPGSGCSRCAKRFPTSAFRCCCGHPMRLATPAYPDNVV